MTKKSNVFIIVLASILSILLIAVWGSLPENANLPPIEYLEFNEYDMVNDEGDKLIDVKPFVTITNPIFVIAFDYGPTESYSQIRVSLTVPSISYQLDDVDKLIYIFYSLEDIEREETLTVTIRDTRTQKQDSITLWFKPSGVIIVPD